MTASLLLSPFLSAAFTGRISFQPRGVDVCFTASLPTLLGRMLVEGQSTNFAWLIAERVELNLQTVPYFTSRLSTTQGALVPGQSFLARQPRTKQSVNKENRMRLVRFKSPLGLPIHLPKSSESVAARKYSFRFTSPSLSFSASVTRKTQSVGALRLSADSTWQFWRGTTPAGLLKSCPGTNRTSAIGKVRLWAHLHFALVVKVVTCLMLVRGMIRLSVCRVRQSETDTTGKLW